MPFHSEQLRLGGVTDEQLQEAAAVAGEIVGFSAYLHGVGYDLDRYLRELDEAVNYIKSQAGALGGPAASEEKKRAA